jgi:WD40 repeat protein
MEGEVVISSSKDQSIYVWEPQSLTILASFSENSSNSKQSLIFTENTLISSQSNKTILHYYTFGKESPEKKSGVLEEITALSSFSNLLLGGSVQGSLFLWDLPTGSLLLTWSAHMRRVSLLSFDDFIISASEDASLKVFRTSSVLQGQVSVLHDLSITMLPITGLFKRGAFLYTCSSDKSLTIFHQWEMKVQKFFAFELTCLEVSEGLNEVYMGTACGQLVTYKAGLVWNMDQKPVTHVRLTLNEAFLLVSTQKVFLVRALTGEKVKTFVMHLAEVNNLICIPRPKDFVNGNASHRAVKPVKKTVEDEPGIVNFSFDRTVLKDEEEVEVKNASSNEETEKLKQMNSILYRLWVEHCT